MLCIAICCANIAVCNAEELNAKQLKILNKAISAIKKDNFTEAEKYATKIDNKIAQKYITWKILINRKHSKFVDLANFIKQNPHWPQLHIMQKQIEAMNDDGIPENELKNWYIKYPPTSPEGKYDTALFALKEGKESVAKEIILNIWKDDAINSDLQKNILKKFRKYIDSKNSFARADKMLWHGQITQATRIESLLTDSDRKLIEARIDLQKGRNSANQSLKKLSKSQQSNEGLKFDRAVWRRKHKFHKDAIDMLAEQPSNSIYPELWWRERNYYARESLQDKKFKDAYKIASKHGMSLFGPEYMEAEWLSGWIALEKLKNNNDAVKHFARIVGKAKTSISSARGYYWYGIALEKSGNTTEATKMLQLAAKYPNTFYGQLAATKITPSRDFTLPPAITVTKDTYNKVRHSELTSVIQMLMAEDMTKEATLFATKLSMLANNDAEKIATIDVLMKHIKSPMLAVTISRKFNKEKSLIDIYNSYPTLSLPQGIEIEKAMVMAIVRQESNFDTNAVSHAGARGLMQLMPATARRMAKDLKKPFNTDMLNDNPTYNVTIGSHYFAKILGELDNNYIMSIASYNAGYYRVKQWIKDYGDPRKGEINILDWVESIPFSETRNYVQRVSENLQLYRKLTNKDSKLAVTINGKFPNN